MDLPVDNPPDTKDVDKIWAWNKDVPPAVDRCIHDLFTERALARPSAHAICAWDGEMTYGQLDALSTKLAGHLVQLGVKPEDVVPLCFEKSMWTVVAMLAVLKAGGAFAPLDPDHPASRHEEIFRQIEAEVVLVSAQHSAHWTISGCHVVTVSESFINQLHPVADMACFSATPGNAAYVLFTSGSTGIPKGVVLEHRAVSTSCLGHGCAFGITNQSRVLQFTSYTFDFCMAEIITTLLYGGCICVPSDQDRRSDLAKTINTMCANWALLTPSVARLLNPGDVPTLTILVIGGEQVTFADWDRWPSDVQLINGYGPTECCIVCTMYTTQSFKSGTIGTAIASVSWVVDPENHHKLAPLGSIGELLMEGPILSRGYLNDPDKTAAAFIDDPAWLLEGCEGHVGRQGRLYKTGDLVYYNPDGNLVCVGRKDNQTKVRGQRVELGEIEHHIRQCLPEARQMAVEVVLPSGDRNNATLAAFVRLDDHCHNTLLVGRAAESDRRAHMISLASVEEELAKLLPIYMVPTVFIALEQFPITTSGKTDRKLLREIGASFTPQQIAEMRTSSQGLKRQPSTEAERTMQQLWARVLSLELDTIGLDDSFFRLGGDSIAAMKLVGEARGMGLQFSVADIFRNPKLAALASLDLRSSYRPNEEISAFSLLGADTEPTHVREQVAVSCGVDTSLIEDIYPCSPLQEGMMALTAKRAGDYIMQTALELRADIDEDTLRAAWEQIVRSTATLRTRIVQHSKLGLLQVVVEEDIQWVEAEALEEHLERDRAVSMGLGDPLTRYALVKEPYGGKRWFTWTIHHALYDGWSVPQILHAVKQVYSGVALERQPSFNAFIQYLGQQDHKAATAYWHGTLADCEAVLFPPLPPTVTQPVADMTVEYQCPPLTNSAADTTTSILIRAAWAIVASRYTSSDDVVFGTTVTGRNAPVVGIETITGPTIATVPVRVRVRDHQTVSAFLQELQQQSIDMIAYEQTGLQWIAKMGPGPQHACGLQTLLIVQPAGDALRSDDTLGEWRSHSELQDFTTYALMLQCTLAVEGVQIAASFDRRVVEDWLVEKMLGQLSFVIQQLAGADGQANVASIDTLTPEDRQQLWAWNKDVPPAVDRCIHDLFTEQALARPEAPAIYAWDGELTYRELDALSTKLAGHLVQLGVKPEDVVPLCFEKSMWTVVAMLAVLKAGGAFLLLDTTLPPERLKLMCSKVSAVLALASQVSAAVIQDLVRAVVVVTRDSILHINQRSPWTLSVQSRNTAYVIFTSGSTGEPKGCRIEHQASCSAVVGHGHHVKMQTNTRTLQFGSYSFAGSLAEIILTLSHGGCICIPTEEDRQTRLALAISRMKVNWAFFTSTVLELLIPQEVPSLTTLCVGGESILAPQIAQWENQAHMRQTYGSSETSGFVSSTQLTRTSTTKDIGRASTGVYWVVDPNDHNRLLPAGVVGEVLIEGPILGREYIGAPDKTAATFIAAPAWRCSFGISTGLPRLYKTGDLARHKKDGSLELLGRKDSQVKLRGQRIELGEVEHQARLAETDVKELAVELIKGENQDSMLACFVVIDDSGEHGMPRVRTQDVIRTIQDRLERLLPQYMVPTVFVPIARLPVTWSKKVDRKRLREIGASFTVQQLAEMRTSSQDTKRQPSTEAERTMQQLWARVLGLELDTIGLDDSFFRLGGDSIAAMKLVREAGQEGIQVTTAQIFSQPNLLHLCCVVRKRSNRTVDPSLPFSLLSPAKKEAVLSGLQTDGTTLPLPLKNIVDILPVNFSQALFLSSGREDPRVAFNYFYVDIGPQLDLDLLRDSCRKLMDYYPILRAHFVLLQEQWWQIVLRDPELPFSVSDVNKSLAEGSYAICMRDTKRTDSFELPTLFKVVRNNSTKSRLIVRLSHAQYDGVCLPVLLRTLVSIYQQEPLPPATGFSAYLAHSRKVQPISTRYWRNLLQGSRLTMASAKLRSKAGNDTTPRMVKAEKCIDVPYLPKHFTLASIISSAWALVLSDITGEEDIVFGHLVAGRNSDIPDVAEIVGACLNIVPVRTLVHPNNTSEELMQSVQQQHITLGQSDSMGWDEVVQNCTDWPVGSMYDSLVQHQNIDGETEIRFAGATSKVQWFENPFRVSPCLSLFSEPRGNELKILISGNTNILTAEIACLLVDMLAETVAALSSHPQASLASLRLSLPTFSSNKV